MSLLDIAKKRYSVRKYEDKPVEKEKLEKILACAHVAPTAANLQPVKLLVVQDKERLKSIAKAGNIYNAPLAIIVCADHSKPYFHIFYFVVALKSRSVQLISAKTISVIRCRLAT